jgi:hypothetical protein
VTGTFRWGAWTVRASVNARADVQLDEAVHGRVQVGENEHASLFWEDTSTRSNVEQLCNVERFLQLGRSAQDV